MKILNFDRNSLDKLILRTNVLLSMSAFFLVMYLILIVLRPYNPAALSGKNFKLQPLESAKNESSVALRGTPTFEEGIFKKKQLFNQSLKKAPSEEKKSFMLLGVSLGGKKLAMIRDIMENKDYYCSEGDSIGGFRVKQIFKDKVILESGGDILEINQ